MAREAALASSLALHLPDELVRRVLCDFDDDLDLLGSVCVAKRPQRLLEVDVRRRERSHHDSLTIAACYIAVTKRLHSGYTAVT